MREVDGWNVWEERFPSVRALVKGNQRPPNGAGNDFSFSRDFNGVSSYEEAEKMALEGYFEPVGKMLQKLDKVMVAQRKKNVVFNSVVGYAPHVPNSIMGLPGSMINMKVKRFPMKVVRIKYINSYNCRVSSKEAQEAGIKLVEAILTLEAEGYRVSLDCQSVVQSDAVEKTLAFLSVRVKDAQEPMDLKKMAYPLIHVSYHRALGFTWFRTGKCPKLGSGLGGSFSGRKGFDKTRDIIQKIEGDKHCVVLDIETLVKMERDKGDVSGFIKNRMIGGGVV
jgi:hypothetical protein